MDIFAATKAKFKKALSVPDTHEILFLQGGASLQFSMIPLNLSAEGDTVDYAVTGNFANIAAKEAEKYCRVHIAASSEATGFDRIPAQEELSLSPEAKYFYYCANNTIFGTAWKYVPETGSVPVTAPEADRPVVLPFPSMTPATPPMPSAFAAVSAARTLASSPSTLSPSREPQL